jgi:hypothetical protein
MSDPTSPNADAPSPHAPPDEAETDHTGRGPGRLLVAVYGLLALAATGRSVLQIVEYFDRAPVSYLLSALAAVIYIVATVGLARGNRTSVRVAAVAVSIELVGVLVVGALSYAMPEAFPDKTVWSHFGAGYGYVPLVLPFLGLWWIWRHRALVSGSARAGSAAPRR